MEKWKIWKIHLYGWEENRENRKYYLYKFTFMSLLNKNNNSAKKKKSNRILRKKNEQTE